MQMSSTKNNNLEGTHRYCFLVTNPSSLGDIPATLLLSVALDGFFVVCECYSKDSSLKARRQKLRGFFKFKKHD